MAFLERSIRKNISCHSPCRLVGIMLFITKDSNQPSDVTAKKVMVFCDVFPPPYVGGAEFSIFQTVNSFKNLGCKIQVFSLVSRTKKKQSKEIQDIETPYTTREYVAFPYHPELDGSNRGIAARFFWQFSHILYFPNFYSVFRIAKKFKPDFIYCGNIMGWSLTPWFISKLLRITLVQHVHDYGFICLRRTLMHKKPKIQNCAGNCLTCIPRKVITKIFWPGGILIFVSEKQRELHKLEKLNLRNLKSEIYHPKVSIFPNSFKPMKERKFDFGYIGRISPEKGIELALSALDKIGNQLYLAGVGSEKYERFLKLKYPRGIFLGNQNKWNFLDNVKILIVPSLWNEPAGRVVLEGLLAGCVVIVSDKGGLVEMGRFHTDNLRVFNSENEDSLINLLESISTESSRLPDYHLYESLKSNQDDFAHLVIQASENSK